MYDNLIINFNGHDCSGVLTEEISIFTMSFCILCTCIRLYSVYIFCACARTDGRMDI